MENNIIKKRLSIHSIIQISIVFVSIVISILFYFNSPAIVPIHWNIYGVADGFAPKMFGVFLFPVIIILMYFLFSFLPKIDPHKENYIEFKKVYSIIKTSLMAVFLGIYVVSGLNAVGVMLPVLFWVPFLIGVLFIVLGNYFGKIRHNYFVGIRTPWTLASEEVWNKTHRLGGKLFILGGLGMMIMDLVPAQFRIILIAIIVIMIAVVPMLYSYILYKNKK